MEGKTAKIMEQCDIPVSRDNATYLLQQCIQNKDLECARKIHSFMAQSGLNSVEILNNYLIHLFTICGCLVEATQSFERTLEPSVHGWGGMTSAHANLGNERTAIQLYSRMKLLDMKCNKNAYLSILKACILASAITYGRNVHSQIMNNETESDIVVGTNIVNMYAKCGSLEESGNSFKELPNPNIVSYGAMISGYTQHDEGRLAIKCFEEMQEKGLKPNRATFLGVLKACCGLRSLQQGRLIHDQILDHLVESDIAVVNALIDMYGKCGSLEESCTAFNALPYPNMVSWGAMIATYIQHNQHDLALKGFEKLQEQGMKPDKVILSSILKACAGVGAIHHGRLFHDHVIKNKFDSELVVGSVLVDMYAKCGRLEESCRAFGKLSHQNVVSWGAMIAGYAEHDDGLSTLDCYVNMQETGIKPDKVTFLSLLKACGCIRDNAWGRLIHDKILEYGVQLDGTIGNTLIDMYAKLGCLEEATNVFNKLSSRDEVSWDAMIAGYAQEGKCFLALDCFEKMQEEGLKPGKVTFLSILRACGTMGTTMQGRLIDGQISVYGHEKDIEVGNTLIDMYAKCGSLEEARKVFDKLPFRSVISWSAMISGYAQHGEGLSAVDCFESMQVEGVRPDKVTLLSLIFACSHSGLMERGYWYFGYMIQCHGSVLDMDHYTCLVDLLGRAGFLREAEDLLQTSGSFNISGWMSLLNGCRIHRNMELARRCFIEVVRLEFYTPFRNLEMLNFRGGTKGV